MELSKDDAINLYNELLLIRYFESKIGQLYITGEMGGFCHLYEGQEAIATGLKFCMQNGLDQLITGYRCHAMAILCGATPKEVMAELLGKSEGISKGKGGSMHIFLPENGFYGGHGIVGSPFPLGTGLAFANKYRENNGVAIACIGDGAMNQGQVYESFNMANIWKLPILYIIENNKYGMGTEFHRVSSTEDLYTRSHSFNIPSEKIDGMNLLEVIERTQYAMEYIRSGKGPYLLEMTTYRYKGHSMTDPAKYRLAEEVSNVKTNHDAIKIFEQYLVKMNYVSQDEMKNILKKIRDEIEEITKEVLSMSEPDPSILHKDVLLTY